MDPLTARLAAVSTADAIDSDDPPAEQPFGASTDRNALQHPQQAAQHLHNVQVQQQQGTAANNSGSDALSPVSTPRGGTSPIAVPLQATSFSYFQQEPGFNVAQQQDSSNSNLPSGFKSSSMPPPSPPDPDLDPEALGQLLTKASPAINDTRFSMEEFLKNKARLSSMARRELGGASSSHMADDDDVGSCLEGSGHDAELARQAAHVSSITEGVAEEAKVNKELANLLLKRLDASKKSLECLLQLLTGLVEAESAYSTAMAAAAKVAAAAPLAAPADGGGLAAALGGLVQLPAAAAAGHRQLYLELQLLVDGVRSLWRKYSTAAQELKQAVGTVRDLSCSPATLALEQYCSFLP
eukprot:GHRR01009042.1.p1 GENE.GHRR01009042.1~~GHRR01009042.1.p1  ORF type:complete len:354 (+),score=172.66 GHRR01009042.1:1967-3028(+)